MEHTENSEGDELAMRLDADIQLDSGWLDSLRVGVRRAERDQDVNWSTYNWGSVQPLWGVQGDEAFFLEQGRWVDTTEQSIWVRTWSAAECSAVARSSIRSMRYVNNYENNIGLFGDGHSNSWTNLGSRTNCPVNQDSPEGLYCPVEQQNVTRGRRRRVHHAEVRWRRDQDRRCQPARQRRRALGEDHGLGDRRYPVPDLDAARSATAAGPGTAGSHRSTDPHARGRYRLHERRHVGASGGGEHTNWLPSLNLRFGLTDDQFIRFAVSRAMARPDMGLYKNYIPVARVGPDCTVGHGYVHAGRRLHQASRCRTRRRYTGTAGNPALSPTTADQIDLTYEYYFSNTGSFTLALFAKTFNDYIQYGSYVRAVHQQWCDARRERHRSDHW